jgi:hypothetical protein
VATVLDPEEALAGPLYAVAALLIIVPVLDFFLSVPPAELSSVQWRFAAVGLLSGYTITPILGVAMLFVLSAMLKQRTVQRVLVIACLTSGVGLLMLTAGFLLDMMQVKANIQRDGLAAFNSAANRAIVKHVLSGGVLIFMGWRCSKMIPARVRHRGPKPVHVVSK